MAPTPLTEAKKRRLAFVSVFVVAAMAGPAFASPVRVKPSARDFDRVQAAGRAALFKLGLVDARNCDRTDLRCIDRATIAEAAAFDHAVRVERSVAKTPERGKCKSAMLNRAAGYAKHATNVRKARTAWHSREFAAAARFYYDSHWSQGGRLDGLFVKYC